jgi:hypothetical protein
MPSPAVVSDREEARGRRCVCTEAICDALQGSVAWRIDAAPLPVPVPPAAKQAPAGAPAATTNPDVDSPFAASAKQGAGGDFIVLDAAATPDVAFGAQPGAEVAVDVGSKPDVEFFLGKKAPAPLDQCACGEKHTLDPPASAAAPAACPPGEGLGFRGDPPPSGEGAGGVGGAGGEEGGEGGWRG